ncbi:hypothetical protein [Chlorogloea sp. CCALA 695]
MLNLSAGLQRSPMLNLWVWVNLLPGAIALKKSHPSSYSRAMIIT